MIKITIETTVNKDIPTAWETFTDPRHITQWAFASAEWHAPEATNDLRKGGKFSTRMEAKDGSMGFNFDGEYTEVVPHQVIEYVLADERKVQVKFEEKGSETRIVQTFDAENENPADMQRAGWQAILDNYKSYTESQA